jgi:hypothetical protein
MSGYARGRDLLATPPLIVMMSLQLAIPGELPSGRARFRFTNRGELCNEAWPPAKRKSMPDG